MMRTATKKLPPVKNKEEKMAKQVFFRRKKACPFSGEDALKIDYKDVKLISRYIYEKVKIIPRRITEVSF